MTLIRYNRPSPAFSNLFDNFFNRDISDYLAEQTGTVPSVNVKETNNEFHIEVAAPGLTREDFNIKVDSNVMTISGEKEEEVEAEDEKYNRKEFSYTSFSRSFHLPEMVSSEDIKAKYSDGILKITVPKKEEAKKKPEKVINIT